MENDTQLENPANSPEIKIVLEEGTVFYGVDFKFKRKRKDDRIILTGRVKLAVIDEVKDLIDIRARITVDTLNHYGVCGTMFDNDVVFDSVSFSKDMATYTFVGIREE
jgi:hypothetical protein